MAKTFLDQLVDYSARIIQKIAQSKECVGLIVNKAFENVDEDDFDKVLDNNIFDYQYVDSTTQTTEAYVWVEMEVNRVQNEHIKDVRVYVTVACHKNYMKLDHAIFAKVLGNRRDNLVRYIDKELNGFEELGIGKLSLTSVRTLTPMNGFTGRVLSYSMPDFNMVEVQ